MDLNKHVITNDNSNPLHSSGFAVVANGDRFGSTSAVSFSQRQQIENNRRIVGSYQRSAMGTAHGALRAKQIDNKTDLTRKNLQVPQRSTLQQYNSTSTQRHFVEPAVRSYNPYS